MQHRHVPGGAPPRHVHEQQPGAGHLVRGPRPVQAPVGGAGNLLQQSTVADLHVRHGRSWRDRVRLWDSAERCGSALLASQPARLRRPHQGRARLPVPRLQAQGLLLGEHHHGAQGPRGYHRRPPGAHRVSQPDLRVASRRVPADGGALDCAALPGGGAQPPRAPSARCRLPHVRVRAVPHRPGRGRCHGGARNSGNFRHQHCVPLSGTLHHHPLRRG
mmetsp:Transcript_15616/g.59282  ORF Transcript_15616/g.59282 Transcript_15616/m.59282 type:complete len:218 (-) Transcript_15616:316-969(-)